MITDDYKQLIFDLIEKSEDIDYVIAVYSFVDSYPDKSKNEET